MSRIGTLASPTLVRDRRGEGGSDATCPFRLLLHLCRSGAGERVFAAARVVHGAFGGAGIALSGLLIPEAMGYAGTAGVPPESGLYATGIGLLVYALFGSSRQHPQRLHALDRRRREAGSGCDLRGVDGESEAVEGIVKRENLVRFGTVGVLDGPQVIVPQGLGA